MSRRIIVGITMTTAVVVTAAIVVGVLHLNPFEPDAQSTVVDGSGKLSLTTAHYRVEAINSTFTGGSRVQIKPVKDAPHSARSARFIQPPIELTSSAQPFHPIVVTMLSTKDDDIRRIGAALWDSAGGRVEILPVTRSADGFLSTQVPHFSILGFLLFPNPMDLWQWEVGATVSYLKDFFDSPYECGATGQLDSKLVQSASGYPTTGATIDMNVSDVVTAKTLRLEMCNHREYAMSYTVSGAASQVDVSFPRSKLPVEVHLDGFAGDPLTVGFDFTADSFVWTAVLWGLDVLPGGIEVRKSLGREILWAQVDSSLGQLVLDAVKACASSIQASLDANQGRPQLTTALSCVMNLQSFGQAVKELWDQAAPKVGIDKLSKAVPDGPLILALHGIQRLIADAWTFPPHHLSFDYRLTAAFPKRPTPVTAVDWRSAEYSLTCGGLAPQPFTVATHDGAGQTGAAVGSAGWDRYEVRVSAVAIGDLTGDNDPEAAVMLYCSPQPSNFAVTELQVFGPGVKQLDRLLPPRSGGPVSAIFDTETLSIQSGQLVAVVQSYGPNDTHASGPSSRQQVNWRWDGHQFIVASIR